MLTNASAPLAFHEPSPLGLFLVQSGVGAPIRRGVGDVVSNLRQPEYLADQVIDTVLGAPEGGVLFPLGVDEKLGDLIAGPPARPIHQPDDEVRPVNSPLTIQRTCGLPELNGRLGRVGDVAQVVRGVLQVLKRISIARLSFTTLSSDHACTGSMTAWSPDSST